MTPEPKISICILTIDRYWMTRFVLEKAIKDCGHSNIELLCLDNGSHDKRIIEYMSLIADVHIIEPVNIGVSRGFNMLLRKATGDYIALLDNDIILDENWLRDLLTWHNKIKASGISAIHCVQDKGEYKSGVYVRKDHLVYSTRFFSRAFLNDVGGFDKDISLYGYEDSILSYRSATAGYINYYIPNQSSIHIGHDVGQDDDFRKFKDEQLKINLNKFQNRIKQIHTSKQYSVPL